MFGAESLTDVRPREGVGAGSGRVDRSGTSAGADGETDFETAPPRAPECGPRAGLLVDDVSEELDSEVPVEPSDPWRSA
mgnify:CR=1 FL=1